VPDAIEPIYISVNPVKTFYKSQSL